MVYYDCILKGLPKGTTVDDIYTLLSPHVAIEKPIKLDTKTDSNDASTLRTFAFAVFDKDALAASGRTVEDTIQEMKKRRFTLHGTNVIVDRVREKYDRK